MKTLFRPKKEIFSPTQSFVVFHVLEDFAGISQGPYSFLSYIPLLPYSYWPKSFSQAEAEWCNLHNFQSAVSVSIKSR